MDHPSPELMKNMEPLELLATRRSRRSTAGNRMKDALAEMANEILKPELDDDKDFVNVRDEDDAFGSDFESTDEEAEQDPRQTEEQEVLNEERRARKVASSRLEKATAAAHARHQVSFNPTAMFAPTPKPKAERRVFSGSSFGGNGKTAVGKELFGRQKRQSQRMHTVLNTSATFSRLRGSEVKKAAAPKKTKSILRSYTQDELIALALDNEEGNIIEHRDYLRLEEEKRRRARVVRVAVQGPLLRWTSKVERVKVEVPPSAPQFPTSSMYTWTAGGHSTPAWQSYQSSNIPTTLSSTAPLLNLSLHRSTNLSTVPGQANSGTSVITTLPDAKDDTPVIPTPGPSLEVERQPGAANQVQTVQALTPFPNFELRNAKVPDGQSTTPMPIPEHTPFPDFRIEPVTKNFLVHELGQRDGVSKPSWVNTMEAMFGDHVKWDELKVYVGKGRPTSRPKQTCPVTGRDAPYLDPRTGVPFADTYAYEVLSRVLRHEYDWDPILGCYVGERGGSVVVDGL